ncbi:hypothetical protein SK128_014458, partial [Halocaridina rubra]
MLWDSLQVPHHDRLASSFSEADVVTEPTADEVLWCPLLQTIVEASSTTFSMMEAIIHVWFNCVPAL